MTDIMSAEKRRRLMSRIRSKDTTPERYIRDLLVAAGLTFTKHDAGLPGSPDFVFPRQKLVVFVHGDFWHGWRFPVWQHRMNQFWREKIAQNRARDKRNTRLLRQHGWKVGNSVATTKRTALTLRVGENVNSRVKHWRDGDMQHACYTVDLVRT